jgi:hypothetical protein
MVAVLLSRIALVRQRCYIYERREKRDSLEGLSRFWSILRFRRSHASGGGACESNTPGRLFTPHYGFEDRGSHQAPSASTG